MSYRDQKLQLTDQQQAIVNHNHGPAIVFAVAGAGKTTAIEHRIVRLVQEKIFAPERILVTAFNTKNAVELTERLQRWPGCERVHARTLNALGNDILKQSYQSQLLPFLKAYAFRELDVAADKIYATTRSAAFQTKVSYADELNGIDKDDFMTYVSHCKGNLRYADFSQKNLPAHVWHLATQALAPEGFPWYLDLYRLYERIRRQELGLYTFDDQLMTAWELLASNESMRQHFQQQYDCVIVDEFQDVNKAQAELLDLLVQPHHNYMVVGDDDQTIYEWRGADPSYILSFEKRYKAKAYFMTENFRCMASHVVLANQVIQHNYQRRSKKIDLTRGFGGTTQLIQHGSSEALGDAIVDQVQALQSQGTLLNDMAVLIRVYAQTPPIEQQLIVRGIPYEVVGSVPFYMRYEVNTLVAYCRLAYLEKMRQSDEAFIVPFVNEWGECWNQIYWQPNRYIRRDTAQKIAEYSLRGASLTDSLRLYAGQERASVAEKIRDLAHHLSWLMQAILPNQTSSAQNSSDDRDERSADEILQELDDRIGYTEYLRKSNGFTETGADRAETVAAFIRYARGQGSLLEFLAQIKRLRHEHEEAKRIQVDDRLVLTTIFRAKGMEWPYVFVPNCNDNVIPYKRNRSSEEERRLLYVAITRAKEDLYLHALKEDPLSPFLLQANYQHTLKAIDHIAAAIHKAPSQWNDTDIWAIAVHGCRLHLHNYLTNRWFGDSFNVASFSTDQQAARPSEKEKAAQLIVGCHEAIQNRHLQAALMLNKTHLESWRNLLLTDATTRPIDLPGITKRLNQLETNIQKARRNGEKIPEIEPSARALIGKTLGQMSSHLNSRGNNRRGNRGDIEGATTQWNNGDLVRHKQYGGGIIIRVISVDEVEVKFDYKPYALLVKSKELNRG